MAIVVLGSINIDLVVQVPNLPGKGETVIGKQFFAAAGGKGANQAVAVAKLGCPVYLIGQVGGDNFGQTLLAGLRAAGV
ncbi:MAG: PfkB family carbohydrate kinase, partial [Microcystaceae cyanobacterium]